MVFQGVRGKSHEIYRDKLLTIIARAFGCSRSIMSIPRKGKFESNVNNNETLLGRSNYTVTSFLSHS